MEPFTTWVTINKWENHFTKASSVYQYNGDVMEYSWDKYYIYNISLYNGAITTIIIYIAIKNVIHGLLSESWGKTTRPL